MPRPRPRPQARGLAVKLRQYRTQARMSMAQVAQRLDWSQPTLSRIEAGKRPVTPEEVSALLVIYEVTGPPRDELIEMARDSERPEWLAKGVPGVPAQALTLLHYESEATAITYVDVITITGIFQTPAYARAVMLGLGVPPAEIEARVGLRMERQQLLRRANLPTIVSYMDEAALHRKIGNRHTMVEQLEELLKAAEQPGIELRVVPFDQGSHAGMIGTYTLLGFEKTAPIVHAEIVRASVFLDHPDDVRPYANAVASLDASALTNEQSLRLVRESLAAWKRE
ncbi:helix-turn-helix domain-containing protein [Allosalinactinospora lopnorensis]|uniref:helix-turn-helix domain-containing protein n=1 Tax=Allosalinactinospora lopnorensis TaxID=1352348 RepID=UPI000623CE29|nr:helix-turn-helix transcriptional regulator [Allosalinactinospora lopnorensis]